MLSSRDLIEGDRKWQAEVISDRSSADVRECLGHPVNTFKPGHELKSRPGSLDTPYAG